MPAPCRTEPCRLRTTRKIGNVARNVRSPTRSPRRAKYRMNRATERAAVAPAILSVGRGIGMLLAAAFLFGLHNVFAKYAYDHGATPLTVTAARLWLVALVTALVLQRRGGTLSLGAHSRRVLALIAVLFCFHNWAIMEAFRFLPIGLTVLIVYLYPIMVALMAAALGLSRLTAFGIGAAVAGFAGIGMVLEVGAIALHPWGLALAFLSAVALGANFLGAERLAANSNSVAVLFNLALIGAVALSIIGFASGSIAWPGRSAALYIAGAVGVAPLALIAQYAGIAALGAPRASLVMNCEPVIMMLMAAIFLGEHVGPWQVAGATLVIGAVVALALRALASHRTSAA